jgi:hypothetical protein
MKGTFVSVWDGGSEIRTNAVLNTETGEVIAESVDAGDVENLDREYFQSNEDDEYEICPECHEFILKTVIDEGIGKSLFERQVCSNPDCCNQ